MIITEYSKSMRPLPKWFVFAILILTSLNASSGYSADGVPPVKTDPAVLRVGVIPLEPFAIMNSGKPKGVSIELWEEIARARGWKYRYILLPESGYLDFVPDLEGNKFDVVIGPVAITYQRMSNISFSIPYYITTSNVITRDEPSTFGSLFFHLIKKFFTLPLLILLITIFICSFLIWHKERRNFPDIFPHSIYRGIPYSIWYGFHTMFATDIFFEIKDMYSRVLTIIMLICSLAIASISAATLTSALTLSHTGSKADIDKLEDLKGQTVAIIGGTDVKDYLLNLDFSVVEENSLGDAIEALKNGNVAAVIADRVMVRTYLQHNKISNVHVSDMVIRSNILSFALQKNSPLRDHINESIVALQNSNWIYRMCLHYLDRRDAAFCTL